MKKWIALGVLLTLIAGFAVTHEWLVLKEIRSAQNQLKSSLSNSLEQAEDLNRLESLQRSEKVYESYLDPILTKSQSLMWWPLRRDLFTQWEKDIHRIIDEQTYAKRLELEAKVDQKISDSRNQNAPSVERLLDIAKTAELFNSAEKMKDLVQEEIDAIQDQAKSEDQKLLNQITNDGKNKIQELRSEISKMDEAALLDYLSSTAFYSQIQKPLFNKIEELHQSKLRQSILDEFLKQVRLELQRRNHKLANNRAEDENQSLAKDNSLSDLLTREYEKERSKELSLREFIPAPSPSAPVTTN